jgi:AcrR family transcriptional regulator
MIGLQGSALVAPVSTPGVATTRAERKAQTRQALLDAAAELFIRQGIEATSTQQISDAVGLTRGALYASFRSKEELVLAVGESRNIYLDMGCLWRADLSLAERFALLGSELFELIRKHGERVMVLDLEFLLYTPRHPEESAPRHLRYAAAAEDIGAQLEQIALERREALPMPPWLLATSLIALIRGLWQEQMRQKRVLDERQLQTALRQLAAVTT